MNYERNFDYLGSQNAGVAAAAKFPGCVTMIGGDNNDAVLIQIAHLQIAQEHAKKVIHLVYRKGNSSVQAWLSRPVLIGPFGQVVVGELMDVHGMSIKEYRTFVGPV